MTEGQIRFSYRLCFAIAIVFFLLMMFGCTPMKSDGTPDKSAQTNLRMYPDTANHVMCYYNGNDALSCVKL